MNNLNGNRKNEFRRKQEEKQRKLALKIEDEVGELREGSLKSEEAIPSLDELCAMGEQTTEELHRPTDKQQWEPSPKETMRESFVAKLAAARRGSVIDKNEEVDISDARAAASPKIAQTDFTKDVVTQFATPPASEPTLKRTPKAQSLSGMVGRFKKHVAIICYDNCLYYYTGRYYKYLDSNQLLTLYREFVDYDLNNESSLYSHRDLYEFCMTDPQIRQSEPENQSIYAPLNNGIYDLMEKKLKPHDPRQLTFTYIKANYDGSAKCPVFDSFLKQITHGNPQLEERFWMAIGYLLIYPAQGKLFIVMGYARDSGKSVLGNFIQRLYPRESVSNLRLQEMKGTFALMPLLSSVINFELDMPNAKLNAEVISRLKQITGGDSITVQRKYLSAATLTRRVKFVMASNHPLCIEGEDEALQKRMVFLPFNESIPDDQQDPYLEDKIWDERDAIVTKALHYARKLVKLNYKFPEIPQVDDAKCIVRDSIAKTVGKFVQESCDMSEPKAVTATEDLYNAYLDYCKEKDMWACSQTAFTKGLTQMGLNHTRSRCTGEGMIVRKNPVSAFQGIKLRP